MRMLASCEAIILICYNRLTMSKEFHPFTSDFLHTLNNRFATPAPSAEQHTTTPPESYAIDNLDASLASGKAMMDNDKQTWNELVEQLLAKASKIIALRGAGSWNGMDPVEVYQLLENQLFPRIDGQLQHPGLVVIMFDGDYDDLLKPDLGYVAGRLRERYKTAAQRVVFLVAQKESWHPDELAGLNLRNAQDLQYPTYLFPDNTYATDHSEFTQDKPLVQSSKYEQWYIGASGKISESQLLDYNSKVPAEEKRKAILFRVKNNAELSPELEKKIAKAHVDGDDKKAASLTQRVEQRKRVYGVHWNNEGQPDVDPAQFPNLEFEFVT